MKRNILFLFFGIIFSCILAFKSTIIYEPKNGTAEVDRIRGLYIFIRSNPVKEYEYLGSIKNMGIYWEGKPKEMINKAIKKAQKQYPEAEALIFQSEQLGKVDAIRFK